MRKLTVLFLPLLLSGALCACSANGSAGNILPGGQSQGATAQRVTPDPNRTVTIDEAGPLPDLVALAVEKWELNSDTVGWLRLPDTAIDDVVLWKPGDNNYYLRRNFDKRHYYNGVYYADKDSSFGDGSAAGLGRNTVIYGHSMSDSKDDVKFGPVRYYLDEDFARQHPYIYFSTVRDNLAWEVIAVFYTSTSLPYNSASLTEEEFAAMISESREKSLYVYDYTYTSDDRFLTLSTCVYSLPGSGVLSYPNDYRLCIMARLVKEEDKILAAMTRNINIMEP